MKLNKVLALVGAVFAYSAGIAHSSEYYIVVPVQNRKAPDTISVTLSATELPAGKVGSVYGNVNFQNMLQVTGDPEYSGADVRWSVQGALPAGLAVNNAGMLTGTPSAPTPAGGRSFQVTATYKSKQGSQNYSISVAARDPQSCREYLVSNPGAPSGWYNLDADGPGGPAPMQSYYCDMTSDGGGWTRVVRQSETQAVANWNGGLNGASYAHSNASIPTHTQVAFGKDEQATALDYVNGTYTAGDIPTTLVTSPKTGTSYHMHRNASGHFSDHDPESGYGAEVTVWSNTLTLDRVGGTAYTWAFSPNVPSDVPAGRGYAFAGGQYYNYDSFAWTVWVR